ncbi:MAG TPA: 2'-5' RNA ligase family protein [Actinomycetales bacterium]
MTGPLPVQVAGGRTVGVAIAIPDPFGRRLQQHRASFGDPLAGSIPTHITLLPPTSLPPAATGGLGGVTSGADASSDPVGEHLAAVAATAAPFRIRLRGTATFRPVSPVVFVQLVEGLGECELLERQVRQGPLQREIAFPYHPHVTIAHDLPEDRLDEAFEALADFDCRFVVSELHLYEHGSDGVWRPEQSFPFTGAGLV